MEPKRTITTNYYDCYEVGYIRLYCIGQGEPSGQSKQVIIKTLNKAGVERLANLYGIKFVDSTDIYATGYYIEEVETTVDPDTFHDELEILDAVFMKEVELRQMEQRLSELQYKFTDWDNFIKKGNTFIIDSKIEKEVDELSEKIKNLDYELHGQN